MKDYVEIIGPCSKWIQDRGWVTKIPVSLIENAGFVRKEPTINDMRRAYGLPPVDNNSVTITLEKPSISCDGLTIRGILK